MSDNPAPVCKLCHVQYNSLERKPRCFMPCGHTFCEKCINGLLEKICPTCKNNYNQAIVDYGLIDIINKAHQLKSALKHACSNQQLKPEIIHLINEGTRDQQLIGLRALRKLLSKETDPPIQEVISAGLVDRLVEFLDLPAAHAVLTYESTWALTNITSGSSEQTQSVVKAGAIPKLVKLISSSHLDTSETAIWTLGNIGGDSAECRDLVINGGALESIANVLLDESKEHSISFKKNGIWALSNFCRNKDPLVDLKRIECIIPVFILFINHENVEILIDCCWAVSYLTDGPNERIEFIIKNFDLSRFVQLLDHESSKVLVPALRIIGNIVTGDDKQTQALLDVDLLPSLTALTKSSNVQIRKEACWTVSNITAGTAAQIQAVIDAGLFSDILKVIKTDTNNQVKKEAVWVFGNALSCGSNEQIKYLFSLNILPVFCKLVNSNDVQIVQICLDSIINLLKYECSAKSGEIASQITCEFEALKQIEKLSKSSDKSVFEKAENIINSLKRKEIEI